jgi:hypothetical protein
MRLKVGLQLPIVVDYTLPAVDSGISGGFGGYRVKTELLTPLGILRIGSHDIFLSPLFTRRRQNTAMVEK